VTRKQSNKRKVEDFNREIQLELFDPEKPGIQILDAAGAAQLLELYPVKAESKQKYSKSRYRGEGEKGRYRST
jgi:hypothetical protein